MTVHVASVGIARFGKRTEGLIDLAAEAAGPALEGVGRKPIDLLVTGTMLSHGPHGPEPILPRLAGRLGLESASGFRVEATSATGAMAFHTAVLALESGRFSRALVVAAEKMTDRPTAEITAELAAALHPSEVAAGATMPGLAAMVTQRYLERHGLSPDVIDPGSVTRERWPWTIRWPTSRRRSLGRRSRRAGPLRSLSGSSTARRSRTARRRWSSSAAPARRRVLGFGQGFESLRLVDRPDLTTFAATRIAARIAYESAKITRKEIEVAEVHDAFAPFGMVHLEDVGVCGLGEGPSWFEKGWVARDGRLPVNPSGGLWGGGTRWASRGW